VFPDAKVIAEANYGSSVTISSGKTQIVSVPQRQLFRKYRWPAAPQITQYLEMFKEEMES